jgi:TM2 domain-containing membrane protein YozV
MANVDSNEGASTETYGRLGTELTSEQKQFFQRQYNKLSKNPSRAWKLTLLLGWAGAHRFYLNQWGWGIIYLLFCWTFIPLLVALVECFYIRERTEKYNKEIEQQIIQTMNIIFSISETDEALAA